jgi:hypothetical protein
MAEMGGRRVPGGVEKVKGLRSAETAEDGSLRAGAERFPERKPISSPFRVKVMLSMAEGSACAYLCSLR